MQKSDINSENREWLERFVSKKGRFPEILHIGNVAGNAYMNALLLNENGFKCDVLCNDYYHSMGCPEWDEALVKQRDIDHNKPNWANIDIGDFQRPRWFAQGPMWECIEYLKERKLGNKRECDSAWRKLLILSKVVEADEAELANLTNERKFSKFSSLLTNKDAHHIINRKLFRSLLRYRSFNRIAAPIVKSLLFPIKKIISFMHGKTAKEYNEIKSNIIERYDKVFKKGPRLGKAEFNLYDEVYISELKDLFEHYDLIIGYGSPSPIYPLLAGNKPYIAYEHGTLRDSFTRPESVTRLTVASYAFSKVLFNTNADCMEVVDQIGAAGGSKVIRAFHGFDERKLKLIRNPPNETQSYIDRAKGKTIFLAPARQDWDIKGNNLILEAAKQLARKGIKDFLVFFTEWGSDVKRAKKFIDSEGLGENCVLIPPLCKVELRYIISKSDCVIDQFLLPCIAGISIEVMAMGKTCLIANINDREMERFYGATPPILKCKDLNLLIQSMQKVIEGDEVVQDSVRGCKEWMSKYHSHCDVLNTLIFRARQAGI